MTPCSPVEVYRRFGTNHCLIFRQEGAQRTRELHRTDYTMSLPYRQYSLHTHCLDKLKKGVFLSIAIVWRDLQQYTCLFVAALNVFTRVNIKKKHATNLAVCHFVLQSNRRHLLLTRMLHYYQGMLENICEGKHTYNGCCVMSEGNVDMGRWRTRPEVHGVQLESGPLTKPWIYHVRSYL